MKKLLFCFSLFIPFSTFCQGLSPLYLHQGRYKARIFNEYGTELIFSAAPLAYFGDKQSTPIRYSGSANGTFHFEFGRYVGFYTGIGIRNIGLVHHTDSVKYKYRTFNLPIPIGLKIGDLKRGIFIHLGGEFNYAFNYREKKFIDRFNKIDKYNEFGSKATPDVQWIAFAGFRYMIFGAKFGYVFNNYLNPGYTRKGTKPHEGYSGNLMFIALTIDMTLALARGPKISYYKEFKGKENKIRLN